MKCYLAQGYVKEEDNWVKKAVIASNKREAAKIINEYGIDFITLDDIMLVAETSETTERVL